LINIPPKTPMKKLVGMLRDKLDIKKEITYERHNANVLKVIRRSGLNQSREGG
jgi:peptide subunit release factor 1 (eRF1)